MKKYGYFIILGSITLVLLMSQLFLQSQLQKSKDDGHLVNLSGRQRMLSQQLSKDCFYLIEYSGRERFGHIAQMDSIVEMFNETHLHLQENALFTDQLAANFFATVTSQSNIYNAVKSIVTNPQNDPSPYVEVILENENEFLLSMNNFTFLLSSYSDDKIREFAQFEIVLLFVTLSLILAEVLIIFLPLFKSRDKFSVDKNKLLLAVRNLQENGVLFVDLTGNILESNPAITKMYGYTEEEIKEVNLSNLFGYEAKDLLDRFSTETIIEEPEKSELLQVRKDQSVFTANVWINPVKDISSNVVGYSVLIRNMTESKIAEKATILQTQHEDMEQFSHIVSHDLKEPVRTINNYMFLIGKEHHDELSPTVKEYLNNVEKISINILKMINGLLDFTRLGVEKKLSVVHSKNVVGEIKHVLDAQIRRTQGNVEVGDLPEIEAYEMEFRQLLSNLISNALKYGRPDVETHIKIEAEEFEDHWLFWVSDNGIGISAGFHEKIFDVFKKAHEDRKEEGLGLGLAFCKKVVSMHNGDIWVKSVPNQGSTFYFTISKNLP